MDVQVWLLYLLKVINGVLICSCKTREFYQSFSKRHFIEGIRMSSSKRGHRKNYFLSAKRRIQSLSEFQFGSIEPRTIDPTKNSFQNDVSTQKFTHSKLKYFLGRQFTWILLIDFMFIRFLFTVNNTLFLMEKWL